MSSSETSNTSASSAPQIIPETIPVAVVPAPVTAETGQTTEVPVSEIGAAALDTVADPSEAAAEKIAPDVGETVTVGLVSIPEADGPPQFTQGVGIEVTIGGVPCVIHDTSLDGGPIPAYAA